MLFEIYHAAPSAKEAGVETLAFKLASGSALGTFFTRWITRDLLETADYFRKTWHEFKRGCKTCKTRVTRPGAKGTHRK